MEAWQHPPRVWTSAWCRAVPTPTSNHTLFLLHFPGGTPTKAAAQDRPLRRYFLSLCFLVRLLPWRHLSRSALSLRHVITPRSAVNRRPAASPPHFPHFGAIPAVALETSEPFCSLVAPRHHPPIRCKSASRSESATFSALRGHSGQNDVRRCRKVLALCTVSRGSRTPSARLATSRFTLPSAPGFTAYRFSLRR